MRILPEIVIQILLPFTAGAIADLAAVGVVVGQFVGLADETFGHRVCVPAPLRHCAERCGLFVKLGKSLQAGHVAGKGKFTVADRQRRERLELSKTGSCRETSARRLMFRGCSISLPDPIFDNVLPATTMPINVRRVILGCFNCLTPPRSASTGRVPRFCTTSVSWSFAAAARSNVAWAANPRPTFSQSERLESGCHRDPDILAFAGRRHSRHKKCGRDGPRHRDCSARLGVSDPILYLFDRR